MRQDVSSAGMISMRAVARESDDDERGVLSSRLVLYGKATVGINVVFFVGFQLLWSSEPSVGAARAWAATLGWGSIITLLGYAGLWVVPLVRNWQRRSLRVIELACFLVLAFGFGGITLAHPMPSFSIWEVGLALTAILMLRALLVPSPPLWTLFLGVVLSTPSTIVSLAWPEHFSTLVSAKTMAMLILNRCITAIACSVVASAVLYRLRRQVREARRLGQYTLEERLGQGGMGVVYRARHALLRRPTAIKLLRAAEPARLTRFESEVQLMARLRHPNTVVVHDYGHTEDGVFYYAMEYLDGLDLEQLVEMDGRQPGGRVVHILRQTCGALAEAHAFGLIHRDIKPANIFLCHSRTIADFVKVLDFGLAKDLNSEPNLDATLAGTFVGTPNYIAPESINHSTPPDGRTDLYSLGAVAYRLLSGAPVFEGKTTMEICAHHLHSTPCPLHERTHGGISADLEAVVMQCLEKDPSRRFGSALELLTALESCQDATAWTDVHAEDWWANAHTRIDTWRGQHRRTTSLDADSIIVAPRRRRSSGQAVGSR